MSTSQPPPGGRLTAADLSDSTLRFYQAVRFRAAPKRRSTKRASNVGEELHDVKYRGGRSLRHKSA